MNVLNGSSYRRHNVKVTYQQICNWFANQRAANSSDFFHEEITSVESYYRYTLSIISGLSSILLPPQSHSNSFGQFRPKFDFNSLLGSKQANGSGSDEITSVESYYRYTLSIISGLSSILLPPQSHSNSFGQFRPKFDFNSLLGSKQANGSGSDVRGSESPTPNDDISVHSAIDCGFDQISDSATSSPEISFDLNSSHASIPPKPASGDTVGYQDHSKCRHPQIQSLDQD
ncbi:unnamed protein product [Brugia pahangi]|uniref:Homeobox domain-containing protein n=1 Tax=Brugia pahangi TaxID=6280 RepID=A0A0N4TZH2_BRUPA|nr:unnamed protein product [Brugia pahangi]